MVYFVGAGCGAPDLITLRGKRLIEQADVLIYAGSLVNPQLLAYARPDCRIYNSAVMTLDEVLAVMQAAQEEDTEKQSGAEEPTGTGKKLVPEAVVVRLHTGEPSLYGAVREQMDALDRLGIPYKSCPGVSACFGAAASMNVEFTLPGVSQTLIITRMEGRTAVPQRENIESLASHGASMAIYLSASMTERLQDNLLRGGYAEDTPAAIVYKATWPEEKICRCTVGTLHRKTREEGIDRIAVILVGSAIAGHESGYERSRLYAPDFETGFRKASAKLLKESFEKNPQKNFEKHFDEKSAWNNSEKPEPKYAEKTSVGLLRRAPEIIRVAAFSRGGRQTAAKLFEGQNEWIPEMRAEGENLFDWTGKAFRQHLPLLFVGAAGIAVRAVSPFVQDKLTDSAVLVMDEAGQTIIPLLSGHAGGANDLAQKLACRAGAQAVITTGTDVRGRFSPDVFARRNALAIQNRKAIRVVSEKVLRGQTIRIGIEGDIQIPEESPCESVTIFSFPEKDGSEMKQGTESHVKSNTEPDTRSDSKPDIRIGGLPEIDGFTEKSAQTLILTPKRYTIGLGCRRGKAFEELNEQLLDSILEWNKKAEDGLMKVGNGQNQRKFDGIRDRTMGRKDCESWIRENVSAFATIDLKAEERGLILLSQYYHLPLYLFSAEQLQDVPGDFNDSEFVKEVTGVSNVCERAAVKAGGTGSRLILPKRAGNGVTVAAALHPARIATWNTEAGLE